MVLLLWVSSIATADVIYVDCNGPNDPGSGTSEDPFRQIQPAINASSNSDIVRIAIGIYTGTGNYDLDPEGKSITICSSDANDPDVTILTIIDANQAGRGFDFHSDEDTNCVVAGLTIRNCSKYGVGGAIYCSENTGLTTQK